MNDFPALFLALGAGVLLGAFFFGGLWWTVQKGVASRGQRLWFLGSLWLLRTSLILAGFYISFRKVVLVEALDRAAWAF